MKLIIAGGREFNDYDLLKKEALEFIGDEKVDTIISGMAPGADTLGVKFAKEFGYDLAEYPADWKAFGRRAGPIRNKIMAHKASHLLAFWNGKSTGTRHMINYGSDCGLAVKVIDYA